MAALDIVLPIRVRRIDKTDISAGSAPSGDTHSAGYAAGYEEGKLRAEWEAKRQRDQDSAKVQALLRTLENLHSEYESLLGEHLPDLIQGALNRVFRQHPFTPEELTNEVSALLRDMEQAGRIALECAPAEAEELSRRLQECNALPDDAKWSLEANPALRPGEFVLRSDLGDVDGRHSTRIRQIHHALETKS
jgi:flagellar biosynthesis/type III secretory pathway protein FliH